MTDLSPTGMLRFRVPLTKLFWKIESATWRAQDNKISVSVLFYSSLSDRGADVEPLSRRNYLITNLGTSLMDQIYTLVDAAITNSGLGDLIRD